MNKKVLGIATMFLIAVILATPVLAAPTQGQKYAVTVYWTNIGQSDPIDPRPTGKARHALRYVNWSVTIDIDGLPDLTGTSLNTERYITNVPQPNGLRNLYFKEVYDFEIDEANGGFRGSSEIFIWGYNASLPGYEKAKAHGLLQGYGDFEGQTINAGHHFIPAGAPVWWGYILVKP